MCGRTGDDITDQPFGTVAVTLGRHGRGGNPRVLCQGCFDLAELDAVALYLDLKVLAAQELDVAVRQIATQIARLVQALSGSGMMDEIGRGLSPRPASSLWLLRRPQYTAAPGPRADRGSNVSSRTWTLWFTMGLP